MKKIKADVNQKDRIILVSVEGGHRFYYQPAGSAERVYLFERSDFSGSLFGYFRERGKKDRIFGYSLTIKEIYEFKSYDNPRLTKIMNRIPIMIDYVINEQKEYDKYLDEQYDREFAA